MLLVRAHNEPLHDLEQRAMMNDVAGMALAV